MTQQTYTTDDIIAKATDAINSYHMSEALGRTAPEHAIAARAGILTLLLLLGISVIFEDGTMWSLEPDDSAKEKLN